MTEKRNINDNLFCTTIIIIDLEGVCIQNNFEEEKIFPFVRQHIEEYINKNWTDKSFQGQVNILREQAKLDEEQKIEGFVAIPEGKNEDTKKALLKNLFWQLDSKKITEGFKRIQKEVCEIGYTSGNLKVQLNDKIDTSIRTWSAEGKKVFILSSCNLDEQKILLTNTEKGDLSEVIVGYFDEKVGLKNEKETYAKILEKLQCPASDVMFICNKSESALAASATGLVTLLISKDDTVQQGTNTGVTVINSISEIEFEVTTKKRKIYNESVDVSVLHSGEELSKNVSNKSDVEMMDVSENERTENTLKKVENGQDNINPEENKSNEVTIKSNSIELGDGDSIKIDNNEISVKTQTKIDDNEVKDIEMEIELNGITDVNQDLKLDETKVENEKSSVEEKVVTSSNLQNTSVASNIILDDESAHKTELEPLTEEKKTDKKVDILDREDKSVDVDVSIKAERNTEKIENENKNSLEKDQHPASEKSEIEVDNLCLDIEPNKASIDNSAVNTKTENSVVKEEDKPCPQSGCNDIAKPEVEEKQKINIPSELNIISIVNDKSENKDKQINEQCSSSKNNTANKDVCSEKPKSDMVSEDNIVDTSQSSECNTVREATDNVKRDVGDKDINTDKAETENIVDNSQSNTVSIDSGISKPEGDDKTSLSSEINTVNIDGNIATPKVSEDKNAESDNDIAQPEIGVDKSLSTENITTNMDVDAATIEPIKLLQDKNVNSSSQSLESNTINIDKVITNPEDSDNQIGEQCSSSEDNTTNMDVDATTIKPNKSPEEKHLDNSQSLESNTINIDKDITKPEDGGKQVDKTFSSSEIISQDNPAEEKHVDSSQSPKSNTINLDNDIAKPEDRSKQEDKTCSSSEIVSTSMDVDGATIESDKTSKAIHVDGFQPSESNTVNFDKDSVKPNDGGKQVAETCSSSEITTASMDIDTATIKEDKSSKDKNIDHSQLPESSTENFNNAITKPDEQCSTSEVNATNIDIDIATFESDKHSENKTVGKYQSPEGKILSVDDDDAKPDVLDKLGCSMDIDAVRVESDKISVDMNVEKAESNYDITKPIVLVEEQCQSSENNTENMDVDTANIDMEKPVKDIITRPLDSNLLTKNVEEDKPSAEKKIDETGQISLNVLTENGESKDTETDLKNEIDPVVISETTNDQNKVGESQELAGISEATKKSLNNEIKSNLEEEKTDVTESLNGTTANEKAQNGIKIGSGNEEKYIHGDNEITNGEKLPSSEKKQVVKNSLTTGTEIEA